MADSYVRQLMAQTIGRKLKRSEVVHHIDGDRSNNSIENLRLFASRADHMTFHALSRLATRNGQSNAVVQSQLDKFDWAIELQKERLLLAINQEEFGDILGVSVTAYAYLERGDRRPSLKMRVKLAKLLGGRFRAAVQAEDGIIVPEVER